MFSHNGDKLSDDAIENTNIATRVANYLESTENTLSVNTADWRQNGNGLGMNAFNDVDIETLEFNQATVSNTTLANTHIKNLLMSNVYPAYDNRAMTYDISGSTNLEVADLSTVPIGSINAQNLNSLTDLYVNHSTFQRMNKQENKGVINVTRTSNNYDNLTIHADAEGGADTGDTGNAFRWERVIPSLDKDTHYSNSALASFIYEKAFMRFHEPENGDKNIGLFHMIILVLYEGIQRTVNGVVLAGLDLDGDGGEAVVIVDQIIHLALAAVIVIEQIESVGDELAGDDALIDRAEVDAPLILQNRTDIVAVQDSGQNTDVVQIELQQVLAGGLDQREGRCGDGLHVQRNACADQVFELIFIIGEGAAFLSLNPLRHHALFLVLQVGGDLIVDTADLQLAFRIILGGVGSVVFMDLSLDLAHGLDIPRIQVRIDRRRQAAYQKVAFEGVHHFAVHGLVQRLPRLELLAQGGNGKLVHAVGVEKFLEVQREHAHLANAADGDGGRLRQRYPQQGAAGNIGKAVVIPEEFQHRQQMGVGLDLVDEDQRILCLAHQLALDRADAKVEIIYRLRVFKQPLADGVLQHVDLNEIGKQLFSDVADDICLSDLTRAVDQQNAFRAGLQVLLDQVCNFSFQHDDSPRENFSTIL